jgi:ComF family protein
MGENYNFVIMKKNIFLSTVYESIIYLFYPKICLYCNKPLNRYENIICLDCFTRLEFTNHATWKENPVAKLFYGKVPLTHAMALIKYEKHTLIQKLLHELKYHQHPEIGQWLGRMLGQEILKSPYLKDVEILIPIPLHPKKQKIRGYNQSEMICEGIKEAIPMLKIYTDVIVRKIFTETQTNKKTWERYQNVKEVFALEHEEKIKNKHILIVDDVITTGSTIEACAKLLLPKEGTKVSAASIASPA